MHSAVTGRAVAANRCAEGQARTQLTARQRLRNTSSTIRPRMPLDCASCAGLSSKLATGAVLAPARSRTPRDRIRHTICHLCVPRTGSIMRAQFWTRRKNYCRTAPILGPKSGPKFGSKFDPKFGPKFCVCKAAGKRSIGHKRRDVVQEQPRPRATRARSKHATPPMQDPSAACVLGINQRQLPYLRGGKENV